MSDLHPIKVFHRWYQTLSKELRAEVGGLVLACRPDETEVADQLRTVADPEAEFERWLQSEPSSPYRIFGRMLFIRSTMEYLIIRRFGDPHDWEEKREMLKDMILEFRTKGDNHMAGVLQQSLDSSPQREDAWLKTAATWANLTKSELSTEVIEAWLHEANLKRRKSS